MFEESPTDREVLRQYAQDHAHAKAIEGLVRELNIALDAAARDGLKATVDTHESAALVGMTRPGYSMVQVSVVLHRRVDVV